ncbi:DUF2061 domain-containing protein [Lutibacter sp.]
MLLDHFFKSNKRKSEKSFTTAKNSDKPARSIVKAISWRVVGTLDTILISWVITGEISMALSIGLIEIVTKMVLYFFHERIWNLVKWGKQ